MLLERLFSGRILRAIPDGNAVGLYVGDDCEVITPWCCVYSRSILILLAREEPDSGSSQYSILLLGIATTVAEVI